MVQPTCIEMRSFVMTLVVLPLVFLHTTTRASQNFLNINDVEYQILHENSTEHLYTKSDYWSNMLPSNYSNYVDIYDVRNGKANLVNILDDISKILYANNLVGKCASDANLHENIMSSLHHILNNNLYEHDNKKIYSWKSDLHPVKKIIQNLKKASNVGSCKNRYATFKRKNMQKFSRFAKKLHPDVAEYLIKKINFALTFLDKINVNEAQKMNIFKRICEEKLGVIDMETRLCTEEFTNTFVNLKLNNLFRKRERRDIKSETENNTILNAEEKSHFLQYAYANSIEEIPKSNLKTANTESNTILTKRRGRDYDTVGYGNNHIHHHDGYYDEHVNYAVVEESKDHSLSIEEALLFKSLGAASLGPLAIIGLLAYRSIFALTSGQVGIPGDPGDIGMTGEVGMDGPDGLKGLKGVKGNQGTQGSTGAPGATGSTGMAGAEGATGSTGATGDPGVTGSTGATGPVGATGDTGEDGMVGDMGDDGARGEEGEQGDRREKRSYRQLNVDDLLDSPKILEALYNVVGNKEFKVPKENIAHVINEQWMSKKNHQCINCSLFYILQDRKYSDMDKYIVAAFSQMIGNKLAIETLNDVNIGNKRNQKMRCVPKDSECRVEFLADNIRT